MGVIRPWHDGGSAPPLGAKIRLMGLRTRDAAARWQVKSIDTPGDGDERTRTGWTTAEGFPAQKRTR